MPKLKHHFVPQLYLRLFASAPNRIHLYNFRLGKIIRDASLRNQCYKHRFYGKSEEIEDTLARTESEIAPVLQRIVSSSRLPQNWGTDHVLLLSFVVLQMLRTSSAAKRLNDGMDRIMKQVLRHDPRVRDVELDLVHIGIESPVLASLRNAPDMLWAISDLRMHIICGVHDQVFITSDAPVFKYNQYYEGFVGVTMTGSICRGLQLFFPLSPKHLLMLYDSTVYQVGVGDSSASVGASDADVATLNFLQAIGADQNLYYHDWGVSDQVLVLAQKAAKYRVPASTYAEEFVEVGNEERSTLIHVGERMPNLSLGLSFMSIFKSARKLSRKDRFEPGYRYRKEFPDFGPRPQENAPTGKHIFRRKGVEIE